MEIAIPTLAQIIGFPVAMYLLYLAFLKDTT